MLRRSLLVPIVLALLTPLLAQAESDTDARIEKLEAQLRAMQAELERLKAEKVVPAVEEKEVAEMVEKVLAERSRPELGPTDLRVFWKDGLNFQTQDGDFKMKFGGRIMWDSTWVSEDDDIKADVGEQQDGTEFRRVRLYTSGLLYGNIEYKLQFDFAGGDADLKGAWIGLPDFPLGYLKMGHFKEPFGLEELTSSKYITFMERVLSSVDPARNAGLMLYDTIYDDRMTWAAGVFRITDDFGEAQDDGGYSITGRVTGLPVYENEGASLLHLGAAYSHRDPEDNLARFRSKPEAHQLDYFINTGFMSSDDADVVGLESAWVEGPLSLQGEYFYLDLDRTDGGSSVEFDGYYGQVSYFLTGEHRRYKKSAGAFTRIRPHKNFGDEGGIGAWEIAARYSEIDLNDGDVSGGEMNNRTVGLNWYLNPNTRVMWNYVHSDLDYSGDADILLMRLQIDF
jgi:phosphate-selective porin OprO/OprP